MGSFNTTCNVSKATIRPGQRVMLYFLMADKFTSNFCTASSTYKPITFGMSARYEDAALYEIDPENFPEINAVVDFVKKNFTKIEDEWGYDKKDYNIENLTPANIVYAVRDLNLIINPFGVKEVKIATTSIIMEVYDHIIINGHEAIQAEYDRSKEGFNDQLSLLADLRQARDLARGIKPSVADAYDYWISLKDNVRKEHIIKFMLNKDFGVYSSSDMQHQILWRCATHLELSRVMEDWGIHWAPAILSGQKYEYSNILNYHRSMLSIFEKKQEECLDED